MYKLMIDSINNQVDKVMLASNDNVLIFGLDNPQSSAYQNFKKAIFAETAELQDADGNTMTAAEAKSYIATLP